MGLLDDLIQQASKKQSNAILPTQQQQAVVEPNINPELLQNILRGVPPSAMRDIPHSPAPVKQQMAYQPSYQQLQQFQNSQVTHQQPMYNSQQNNRIQQPIQQSQLPQQFQQTVSRERQTVSFDFASEIEQMHERLLMLPLDEMSSAKELLQNITGILDKQINIFRVQKQQQDELQQQLQQQFQLARQQQYSTQFGITSDKSLNFQKQQSIFQQPPVQYQQQQQQQQPVQAIQSPQVQEIKKPHLSPSALAEAVDQATPSSAAVQISSQDLLRNMQLKHRPSASDQQHLRPEQLAGGRGGRGLREGAEGRGALVEVLLDRGRAWGLEVVLGAGARGESGGVLDFGERGVRARWVDQLGVRGREADLREFAECEGNARKRTGQVRVRPAPAQPRDRPARHHNAVQRQPQPRALARRVPGGRRSGPADGYVMFSFSTFLEFKLNCVSKDLADKKEPFILGATFGDHTVKQICDNVLLNVCPVTFNGYILH